MQQHTVSPLAAECAGAEMSCHLLLTAGLGIWLSNHMPFMCADVAACLEDRGELSSGLGFFLSLQVTIIIWGWQNIYLLPHSSRQSPGPAVSEAAINPILK